MIAQLRTYHLLDPRVFSYDYLGIMVIIMPTVIVRCKNRPLAGLSSRFSMPASMDELALRREEQGTRQNEKCWFSRQRAEKIKCWFGCRDPERNAGLDAKTQRNAGLVAKGYGIRICNVLNV